MKKQFKLGFRLLSELYSLLYIEILFIPIISMSFCFRLLSELYSLLFLHLRKFLIQSPLGFRLLSELYSLLSITESIEKVIIVSFRLLSELYSLLYGYLNHWIIWKKIVSVSSRSYILSYPILKKSFVYNSL